MATALKEQKYSFLSTGTPTYWPTDSSKTPDLLDFFVTNGTSLSYMDIEPNYDLSSDHTPIIVTVSITKIIHKKASKLHNSRTNWDDYRSTITDTINLKTRLKTPEELEQATKKFNFKLATGSQASNTTTLHW